MARNVYGLSATRSLLPRARSDSCGGILIEEMDLGDGGATPLDMGHHVEHLQDHEGFLLDNTSQQLRMALAPSENLVPVFQTGPEVRSPRADGLFLQEQPSTPGPFCGSALLCEPIPAEDFLAYAPSTGGCITTPRGATPGNGSLFYGSAAASAQGRGGLLSGLLPLTPLGKQPASPDLLFTRMSPDDKNTVGVTHPRSSSYTNHMNNVRQLAPPSFDFNQEAVSTDYNTCFKSDNKPQAFLAQLTPTGSSTSSGATTNTLGHPRNASFIQQSLGATPSYSVDEQIFGVQLLRKRQSFNDDDELNLVDFGQKVLFETHKPHKDPSFLFRAPLPLPKLAEPFESLVKSSNDAAETRNINSNHDANRKPSEFNFFKLPRVKTTPKDEPISTNNTVLKLCQGCQRKYLKNSDEESKSKHFKIQGLSKELEQQKEDHRLLIQHYYNNNVFTAVPTIFQCQRLGVRTIGPLPIAERLKKIQKFKQKKLARNFKKKVNYKCRKQLAEKRMRVKGRFVNKQLAAELAPAPIDTSEERGQDDTANILGNENVVLMQVESEDLGDLSDTLKTPTAAFKSPLDNQLDGDFEMESANPESVCKKADAGNDRLQLHPEGTLSNQSTPSFQHTSFGQASQP